MVINSATGATIATISDYDLASIDGMLHAAEAARPARTAKDRAAVLRDWYALLIKH